MSLHLLRSSDGWWAATNSTLGEAVLLDLPAGSTRELLHDRSALDAAVISARANGKPVSVGELRLLSPVTAPCRLVAQMTNYVSHVKDSGMNPETVPLTFFRKTSGSIAGPLDEIVKPPHVRFLDYEVEIGLVVGAPAPVGTLITEANWTEFIAGIVVTNDVSARDIQLPKTQFYEAKSYPTFTPIGPALVLLDQAELRRFDELRLRLSVNGQVRQQSDVSDMIYPPVDALQTLSRFQALDIGDVILTGTPGGTALKAPPKPIEILGALMPPEAKWRAFFRAQARNTKYLQDGDLVEASVSTPDGAINAGTQRTIVRFAR